MSYIKELPVGMHKYGWKILVKKSPELNTNYFRAFPWTHNPKAEEWVTPWRNVPVKVGDILVRRRTDFGTRAIEEAVYFYLNPVCARIASKNFSGYYSGISVAIAKVTLGDYVWKGYIQSQSSWMKYNYTTDFMRIIEINEI